MQYGPEAVYAPGMQSLDPPTALEQQRLLRVEAETRLLAIEEAARGLRATKTPATWTDAEKALFKLLPESDQ